MQKNSTLYLKKTEAYARKKLIDNGAKYKLFFCLRKGEVYQGFTTVTFNTLSIEEDTFIEFGGNFINFMEVNGKAVDDIQQVVEGNRINLAKTELNEGENTLRFGYENKYNRDMFGLQTVKDLDGTQYVYIQTVPYYAHRVTPIFDQPNLKGSFEISVVVPEDWTSITTGNLISSATFDKFLEENENDFFKEGIDYFKNFGSMKNFKVNLHEDSTQLSSYLLNLVCGPFERFDLAEDKRYNNIPMSIYCRGPMSQFVKPELDNMFEFNKAGIEFYDKLFGYPYPYSKMDMIFCPEFAWSAMEYPGAVTYSEKLVPKGQNDQSTINTRGSIILHELAHMWFGNLVTMHWWDNLWLNESFAEFICHVAFDGVKDQLQGAGIDVVNPWVMFLKKKYRGYKQDADKSTHPISGDVLHTEQATTIFDGITYSKGASTLKCLFTTIGRDAFQKAMEEYFKKFQYSNTSLQDLLDCIQNHSDVDMDIWRDQWIQKAGFNWLKPEIEDNQLVIKQGVVNQDHTTLRIHAIKVGFFGSDGSCVKSISVNVPAIDEIKVDISEVGEFEAILLNYEDQDFVQVKFDEKSFKFFKENISKIQDPLSKALIIRAFYDAVFNGEIKTPEFCEIFDEFMQTENSIQMWEFCFELMLEALVKFTSADIYNEIVTKIYQILIKKIENSESETDKKFLIKELIKYATNAEKAEYLVTWLMGKNPSLNFEPTIAQTWKITEMICAYKEKYGEYVEAALKLCDERDQTDSKIENKLKLEALSADEKERENLVKIYMSGDHDWSVDQLRCSIKGYTSKHIPKSIKVKYIEYFFDNLLDAMRNQSQTYAKVMFFELFPKDQRMQFCLERLTELMSQLNPDESFIRKALQTKFDDLSRKVAEALKAQVVIDKDGDDDIQE